jgi:hypothetical protein
VVVCFQFLIIQLHNSCARSATIHKFNPRRYDVGCDAPDVNCTHPGCAPTPNQPPPAALEAEWLSLYAQWFAALRSVHANLLWVNNLLDELEPGLINVSNGRMVEGTNNREPVLSRCSIAQCLFNIYMFVPRLINLRAKEHACSLQFNDV